MDGMRACWLDIYSVCLVTSGIETVASSILADAQVDARGVFRAKKNRHGYGIKNFKILRLLNREVN